MVGRRKRDSAFVHRSVAEAWCARLPEEKSRVFDAIVHEWEDAYAVFSIPLDDAIAFHAEGKLPCARQCAEIASAFVAGLMAPLSSSCRTMQTWGRRLAAPPSVNALNPQFYRTETARQTAQWNQVTHTVLFGSRSRFLHKLHALEAITMTLGEEFYREAEELFRGLNLRPASSWSHLDELHYDLNTCLRETVVVLKSFLLALPDGSLPLFHRELIAGAAASREAVRHSPAVPSGRLAAHFRRQ